MKGKSIGIHMNTSSRRTVVVGAICFRLLLVEHVVGHCEKLDESTT